MTRKEAKRRAELYSALAEGKIIQFNQENGEWADLTMELIEVLSESAFRYRIKPEPNYRPFKTKEECWEEMHKHPDFGFIREKGTKAIYSISMIGNLYFSTRESEKLGDALYIYEFMDGEPFGIREE